MKVREIRQSPPWTTSITSPDVMFRQHLSRSCATHEHLSQAVGVCSDLEDSVVSIDNDMETAWNLLDEAAVVTSCRNINSLYQAAVYDQLCEKLPEGLLGLWVSGVFLTVLLLLLVRLVYPILRRSICIY